MKHFRIILLVAAAVLAAACKDNRDRVIVVIEPIDASVASPASERPRHIFYEANPKLFAVTDQLSAIRDHFSEMNSYGYDVLWLMPIYPIGTLKAFGSPYCVKDYKAIRPEFSTMDEFSSFVAQYHAENEENKIILDWVANHTAWDHPWITEHPDWYVQDEQGNILHPLNWTDVAQLNYSNAGLREAMIDAMSFWVEKGIDGFRCDYAHGVPDSFWSDAIARLKLINPNLLMLAETDYERFYDDGFDVIYSRSLKQGLVNLFSGRTSPAAFMTERYTQAVENVPEGKAKLFFITNHDDASEISPVKQFPGSNASISAYLLAAALDGSSLIYSSQEIGYPSTLNFFETAVLDWNSNWAYTVKFKDAMQTLIHFQREKGFKSYVSGSTVWIIFKDGYLAVNTTGNTVKVEIPPEIPREADKSKRKDYIVLDPYDFDITGCPTDI